MSVAIGISKPGELAYVDPVSSSGYTIMDETAIVSLHEGLTAPVADEERPARIYGMIPP